MLLAALLIAAPAAYAWWTGRTILRSLEDPALDELLHTRQRRLAQVTIGAIVASGVFGSAIATAAITLLVLLVVQYPIRRAVYGDSWSLAQYVRFSAFSFLAGAGLWVFAVIAPSLVVEMVRGWIPESSPEQLTLALVLGTAASVVILLWHRRFTPIWLALHQSSPLATDAAHASLLPRFDAILDRAADRLTGRPSVHRYGASGGRVTNAVALCSLYTPAVAMSDTLLGNLDADEATAIFAHEIAHHEHYHAARLRTRQRWLWLLALLIAVLPALELSSGGRYAIAVNAAFVFAVLALLIRGQAGHRAHETASDLRALELTGDPDALISALTKIHMLARVPRRWAQEFERAATHPSLARRIQAIRARAAVQAAPIGAPTVIASTTPGTYVALDGTRAHWFEGVPADTPLDVVSLRDRATSYRAMAYAELTELRLVAAEKQRALRATDLAGRSWSVDIRDDDGSAVQAALDTVDSGFASTRPEATGASVSAARVLASALVIASLAGGVSALLTIPALVTMFAPTVASLAAMAAMGIGGFLFLFAERSYNTGYETVAIVLTAALGLWSAWIAWRWHRDRRPPSSGAAQLGTRVMFVVLGLVAFVLLLSFASATTSPRDVFGNDSATSLAIALCGLGAALLAIRARTWRVVGGSTVILAAALLVAGTAGERLWPAASSIRWSDGRLTLVATVPLSRAPHSIELSPRGTRYLAQRALGEDDEESYTMQIATGSVAPGEPAHTLTAIDAVLPNETEILVLADAGDDSLELRLERVLGDSAQRVVWRRPLTDLVDPRLRLIGGGTGWQVGGYRRVGEATSFITLSGRLDGSDIHRVELPADTLRGRPLYSFLDGSTLVVGVVPNALMNARRRSPLLASLAALRGAAIAWTIWRHDRDGGHVVARLRGYGQCFGSAEEDVAVCLDQGVRGTHIWSVARAGQGVAVGALSRRYERSTVSPSGQVVASSYRDRSVAIVDVARRSGVRAALPRGDYSFASEMSATSDLVAAVLSEREGARLAVYRVEAAASPAGSATRP
jgi:Zn-dependent protease with chaperone function